MGSRPGAGLLASGSTSRAFPWTPWRPQWLRRTRRVRKASPVTVAGPHRTLTGLPRPTGRLWCCGPILYPAASRRPRGIVAVAMTINLTRIYTKLGDGGETHLGDMSRVAKTDSRIEAYGTIDELNSLVGVVRTLELPDGYDGWLARVQNDLFDVGADVSVPLGDARERLRVTPAHTAWLEERCDEVNARLQPLHSFVLPGGTPVAAHMHVARAVCRRAERRAIACGDQVDPEVVRYLNRLSDLLFILARGANAGDEPLWDPERYRASEPGPGAA